MDNLVIGGKYLVFLNEKFLEAEMRFLSMGNNDRLSYEICSKSKSKLFASSFYGEIFKYSELLEVTENQKWLINKTNHVLFSENINTKTLNFKSNDVSEDFLNYISFDLIDWNDLSAHLIKLSRKYDYNDR